MTHASVSAVRGLLCLTLLAAAGACTDALPVVDPFPVTVSFDAGVPILGARAAEIGDNRTFEVVVDTASAITVIDDGTVDPRRRRVDLELLAFPATPAVARARFPGVAALLAGVGAVGAGAPRDIGGVVGGDVLSRVAVRIDPTRGELRFFTDVAGGDDTQANSCAAVVRFSVPVTDTRYVTGNEAVRFPPSKVVIGACLAPDAPTADTLAGGDSLLALATGIAPTILSRSAYERAVGPLDPNAPTVTIFLPYDTAQNGETARLAKLPRLALVGVPQRTRGPCAELRVSRALERTVDLTDKCSEALRAAGCTCTSNSTDTDSDLCGAAATVELDSEIEVAIVEDTHPLLQAVRNELRPESAEIGGLLGMHALAPLVTDIDYPGTRVLFRCAPGQASCKARPQVKPPGIPRAEELKACLQPR